MSEESKELLAVDHKFKTPIGRLKELDELYISMDDIELAEKDHRLNKREAQDLFWFKLQNLCNESLDFYQNQFTKKDKR